MRILVCNDDGIDAPGLCALVDALKKDHEVHVVAPVSQRSAFSHSISFFRQENMAYQRDLPGAKSAWAIDGTPADCVYYGLHAFHLAPDLVISGINDGPNMGTDILYSGTVGAAMEAVIHHVPAIAVSLCAYAPRGFTVASEIARLMVPRYLASNAAGKAMLNINVPDLRREQIKGFLWSLPAEAMEYEKHFSLRKAEGGLLIASQGVLASNETTKGTDAWAVENGYVALTMLESSLKVADERLHDLCLENL